MYFQIQCSSQNRLLPSMINLPIFHFICQRKIIIEKYIWMAFNLVLCQWWWRKEKLWHFFSTAKMVYRLEIVLLRRKTNSNEKKSKEIDVNRQYNLHSSVLLHSNIGWEQKSKLFSRRTIWSTSLRKWNYHHLRFTWICPWNQKLLIKSQEKHFN